MNENPEQFIPPMEPAPRKKKVWIPIVIAVVVVLALAVCAVLVFAGGNPLKLVVTGAENSAKALGNSEPAVLAKNVCSGGSVSVELGLKELTGVNGSVEATVYMNKEHQAAVTAEVSVGKSDALDAAVYVDAAKYLVIECDELLDGTAYGIDLKSAAKDLEDSFLNPDNDSPYALPEEAYEALEELLDKGLTDSSKDTQELSKAFLNDLLSTAIKSIDKNGEVKKTGEKLSLGDAQVNTTRVTVVLDEDALQAVLTDLLKYVQDSKNLAKLLDEFADMTDEFDPDDLLDAVDDLLDELEDADLDHTELTLNFWVTKSGKLLVKVEAEAEIDGDKASASLAIGPDPKSPAYIAAAVEIDGSKVSAVYTVKENSGSKYTAALKVKEGKSTLLEGELEWNKKNGDFEISVEDYSVTGTLEKEKDGYSFALEEIDLGFRTIELDLTVTVNGSAKMPSAPKYENVLTMDEDDMDDLVDTLEDSVGDLVDTLEDELGSLLWMLF